MMIRHEPDVAHARETLGAKSTAFVADLARVRGDRSLRRALCNRSDLGLARGPYRRADAALGDVVLMKYSSIHHILMVSPLHISEVVW